MLNLGKTIITLTNENGKIADILLQTFSRYADSGRILGLEQDKSCGIPLQAIEILRTAIQKHTKEAIRRYSIISSLDENKSNIDTPERTLRRWKLQYKKAEKLYGYGLIGLIPHIQKRGNRTDKLPADTEKIMQDFIEEDYENFKQMNMKAVYSKLLVACDTKSITPSSYKILAKEINSRKDYAQIIKRKGTKAAYEKEPRFLEKELTITRHGDRPFEIAHIDHTLLPIEHTNSSGLQMGRPWIFSVGSEYSLV